LRRRSSSRRRWRSFLGLRLGGLVGRLLGGLGLGGRAGGGVGLGLLLLGLLQDAGPQGLAGVGGRGFGPGVGGVADLGERSRRDDRVGGGLLLARHQVADARQALRVRELGAYLVRDGIDLVGHGYRDRRLLLRRGHAARADGGEDADAEYGTAARHAAAALLREAPAAAGGKVVFGEDFVDRLFGGVAGRRIPLGGVAAGRIAVVAVIVVAMAVARPRPVGRHEGVLLSFLLAYRVS